MKKWDAILTLMVGLFAITIISAQNLNNVDRVISEAKGCYAQAQKATNRVQRLDLSYQAIQIIMGNLPDDDLASQLRCAETVKPMLLFFMENSKELLATAKFTNEALPDGLIQVMKDTNMKVCATIFWLLDLNSKIKFIWDEKFNTEYAYFLRGRAKFFLNMPYIDDMNKAGQIGQQFIASWKPTEEYSTYYNERFGYYITYPSYLYIQGESQNADGKSFYSNNATIKLSVGAHLNILNEAIAGLANSERQDLTASNHSITYSFVKDSKVIYSGYTPTGNIYYQKSVICSLYSSVYKEKINLITTAYIEYPSTEKTKGDEIIKLLNKFPYK